MNKDYILRMKESKGNTRGGGGVAPPSPAASWKVRPGGMMVQKRTSDTNLNSMNPVPNIRVRVKHGLSYHEVVISCQASFGELKKILAGRTGLHTQDQKLVFKEKERDSRDFLDFCGVKDGSKIVLIQDEKKNPKMEKASEEISAIKLEVDKLAKQVEAAEEDINGGRRVGERNLLSLIELLMTQLIKLDGIAADGDVKLQRRMQVRRVQKHIETLDTLKIRNSELNKLPLQVQQHNIYAARMVKNFQNRQKLMDRDSFDAGQMGVATNWEIY